MMKFWNALSLRLGDPLLFWLLEMPRDAALVILALGSAGMLLALRRWLTDQAWLRLAQADRRQLAQWIKQARRAGDCESLGRYRRTRTAVARARLRRELLAMAVSTVPLLMLLTWAAARLDYLPPEPGQPLQLEARLPATRIGQVVHLVPLEGLEASPGWVRRVERADRTDRAAGQAVWKLTWRGKPGRVPLTVRLGDRSLEHPVLVGQSGYAPPGRRHDDEHQTRVALRPYRPFGLPFDRWKSGLTAWQPIYLALVLALFYAGKRWTRTA